MSNVCTSSASSQSSKKAPAGRGRALCGPGTQLRCQALCEPGIPLYVPKGRYPLVGRGLALCGPGTQLRCQALCEPGIPLYVPKGRYPLVGRGRALCGPGTPLRGPVTSCTRYRRFCRYLCRRPCSARSNSASLPGCLVAAAPPPVARRSRRRSRTARH